MAFELLLGDEAVALGAIHAGIAGAFSYPGTPATEIFETVEARAPDVFAKWSTNEKVAYEEALGMSYAGRRALISMKHVGLNVASDPFMSSALTGVNGGVVLAVGDDPGMHSSQNEQDSRFYADFARIPCFEPATPQECFDLTRTAFELSEKMDVPVMIRLVTRLAHCRATVTLPEEPAEIFSRPEPAGDQSHWTLIPVNARKRFRRLIGIQEELARISEESPWNELVIRGKRGILCTGVAKNYVHEALGEDVEDSLLTIGFFPPPVDLIRKLVDHCTEILVFEDGYPILEQKLRGLLGLPNITIRGRMDNLIAPDGELTPETVAAALGRPFISGFEADEIASVRPPQLCKGCPHSDSFLALVDAVVDFPNAMLFSDIGCYSLGVMSPYKAVHTCVEMGASIGMAHGASRAGGYPVLCTIGEGTFAHSGFAPLLGAVQTNADITVLILDNSTVAMTGTQESMATGDDLIQLLKGLGVEHLHTFEPHRKNHESSVALIKEAIAHKGLSVLVAQRACIHWKSHAPVAATPLCQAKETLS